MTVLIRFRGDEFPVWPGFHDGENWCSADASTLEGPVLGWMELEDAAAILDGRVMPNAKLSHERSELAPASGSQDSPTK